MTRRADVRIITATHLNLEKAVKEGRFREEFFYRLNVIQIEIPPLRERPDDVVMLAGRLLAFYGRNNHKSFSGFTPEASEALKRHHWPGNVRELSNVIERSAILCQKGLIGVEFLPPNLLPGESDPLVGDRVTVEMIEEHQFEESSPLQNRCRKPQTFLESIRPPSGGGGKSTGFSPPPPYSSETICIVQCPPLPFIEKCKATFRRQSIIIP